MRKCLLLFILALLTALPHRADALVRITNDRGGVVDIYIRRFERLRDSGQQVWIDGTCLSACTMVLGYIPADRLCITSRAVFGFHAAWMKSRNGKQIAHKASNRLMIIYPPVIRQWLNRKGGLSPDYKYLQGRELAAIYKPCQQNNGGGHQTIGGQPSGGNLPVGNQPVGRQRSFGGQTIGRPRSGQTIGR